LSPARAPASPGHPVISAPCAAARGLLRAYQVRTSSMLLCFALTRSAGDFHHAHHRTCGPRPASCLSARTARRERPIVRHDCCIRRPAHRTRSPLSTASAFWLRRRMPGFRRRPERVQEIARCSRSICRSIGPAVILPRAGVGVESPVETTVRTSLTPWLQSAFYASCSTD